MLLWYLNQTAFVVVEDPSEDFQRLRDFVDVRNCMKLDVFSSDNLKKGFSKELIKDCQQKLKINKVKYYIRASPVWPYSHEALLASFYFYLNPFSGASIRCYYHHVFFLSRLHECSFWLVGIHCFCAIHCTCLKDYIVVYVGLTLETYLP